MRVLTAGDKEPDVEPKAENHNCQEADCQHQEKDGTRIRTGNEKLGSIGVPKGNVKQPLGFNQSVQEQHSNCPMENVSLSLKV